MKTIGKGMTKAVAAEKLARGAFKVKCPGCQAQVVFTLKQWPTRSDAVRHGRCGGILMTRQQYNARKET